MGSQLSFASAYYAFNSVEGRLLFSGGFPEEKKRKVESAKTPHRVLHPTDA